jgi:hypothetical protein
MAATSVSINSLINGDGDSAPKTNSSASASTSGYGPSSTSAAPIKQPFFNNSRITYLSFIFAIYLLVNTEGFIYHVMRRIPGAVRQTDNVTTGIGTVAQAVTIVLLLIIVDLMLSNGWLL